MTSSADELAVLETERDTALFRADRAEGERDEQRMRADSLSRKVSRVEALADEWAEWSSDDHERVKRSPVPRETRREAYCWSEASQALHAVLDGTDQPREWSPVHVLALTERLESETSQVGEVGIFGGYGPIAFPLDHVIALARENAELVRSGYWDEDPDRDQPSPYRADREEPS